MPGKYTDRIIVEAAEIEAYQANLPDPTDLPATVFWLKDELRRIERASATMEVLLRAVSAELIAVADASPAAGVAIDDDATATGTTWSSDKIAAELSDVEGEVNTTSNAGDGVGLALPKSDEDLPFKSLSQGPGIVLEDDGGTVTVSAPSELDDTDVSWEKGWSSAKIAAVVRAASETDPVDTGALEGCSVLALTALPDKARIGDLSVRVGAAEDDIEDLAADVAAIAAGEPLLAYSSLPDKAAIAALQIDTRNMTLPLFTPDAARHGHVTEQLETIADIAGAGLSTLPLLAKVGGLDERLTGVEEDVEDLAADVAAIAAGDPLLAYSSLPDNARIAALQVGAHNLTLLAHTPDAARYGELSARVGATEEDIEDLAADVAAITAGDPLLAYTALPDKAAIAALSLRVGETELLPLPGMVDAARYGSLHERVTETESDVLVLEAGAAALAADVVEIDHALASLHPLHAKVAEIGQRGDSPLLYSPDAARFGYLSERVGAAEESIADVAADVAGLGDPLLAYSALPDKAAIGALRDDVTAIDRTVATLQPLHGKLAADAAQLAAHEALNESYFAYFEILLTLIADTADKQFFLASAPNAARISALSEQAVATNILAFPGPDAARYAALVGQLKDEVQNLRVEIAALYSNRAKTAHLESRVNDLEVASWL